MKKVSTVEAKQIRNFRDQKLTIGLDLGDRSSWYCVLDEAGEVLLEQKLGTTPKAMKEGFGGMPRSRIACTSMPIYLMSRLISVASLGEDYSCQRLSSPKVQCHSPADLPMLLALFPTLPINSLAAGAERSPAQRSGAEAAPAIPLGRSFIMH